LLEDVRQEQFALLRLRRDRYEAAVTNKGTKDLLAFRQAAPRLIDPIGHSATLPSTGTLPVNTLSLTEVRG